MLGPFVVRVALVENVEGLFGKVGLGFLLFGRLCGLRAAVAPGANDIVEGFGDARVVGVSVGPGDGELAEPAWSGGKRSEGRHFRTRRVFLLSGEKIRFGHDALRIDFLERRTQS